MKNYNTDILFILILGLLSMLTPLAIDMYLPSFGAIAEDLQVSKERIQPTLALFTMGFALGQLLWGPLSDSYGRKSMMVTGVVVAAVIALWLTQVEELYHFYGLRFLQGFFGSAPAVVAGALLRDLFNKEALSKMMSMIMLVTMIAPLVAPILGGHIAEWFHWHAIFYLLAALGLLSALLVWLRIPESLPKEKRVPFDLMGVLHNYRTVGTNKKVLGYIFTNAFSYSGMFCFLTSGSLVYTGVYGVAPQHFGYFFILNIGVMMVATFLSGRFVSRLGTERILRAMGTAYSRPMAGRLCLFPMGALACCHRGGLLCRDGIGRLEQCQYCGACPIPSYSGYRQLTYRNVALCHRSRHRSDLSSVLHRHRQAYALCDHLVYPCLGSYL